MTLRNKLLYIDKVKLYIIKLKKMVDESPQQAPLSKNEEFELDLETLWKNLDASVVHLAKKYNVEESVIIARLLENAPDAQHNPKDMLIDALSDK